MHWKDVVDVVSKKFDEFIPDTGKKPQNGYARGYVFPSHLQLAVETQSTRARTNVWVEDCGPPPLDSKFKFYKEDDRRTSALSSVAPRLSGPGYGKPPMRAYKIFVSSPQDLTDLLNWYSGLKSDGQPHIVTTKDLNVKAIKSATDHPLNTILHGPPGTGKTYSTVLKAMSIVDGVEHGFIVSKEEYQQLKGRYDTLVEAEQIAFVTFHQSYGYEDFIEGIRPETDGHHISYDVKDGILKRIAKAASANWRSSQASMTGAIADEALFNAAWERMMILISDNPEGTIRLKLASGKEATATLAPKGKGIIVKPVDGSIEYNLPKARLKGLWARRQSIKTPIDTKIYLGSYFFAALRYLEKNAEAVEPKIGIQHEEEKPFVLIIDEINRGNIAKIFGELITLVEEDKRMGEFCEMRVVLPYSQDDEEAFSLSPNLYIIGTMNTADRSIALLDAALRRRFVFEELMPNPMVLKGHSVGSVQLDLLLGALNKRVEAMHDRDHTIGHAYLLNIHTVSELEEVFRRKVIPLLQEYFYENWNRIRQVLNDSTGDFITVESVTVPAFGEETGDIERKIYRVNGNAFPTSAYMRIYGE